MPLILLRDDITNIKCDVIVNATNTSLSPGGNGVDARIHSVAGPGLIEECKKIGKVGVGKVVVTGAYGLPSKKVFHTAGPIWEGGKKHEEELLVSCYTEALTLAADSHFDSIEIKKQNLSNEGYKNIHGETKISTPGGKKPYRFVDISAELNGETHYFQVGKSNITGEANTYAGAVARERTAMDDLIHYAKIDARNVHFISYNK